MLFVDHHQQHFLRPHLYTLVRSIKGHIYTIYTALLQVFCLIKGCICLPPLAFSWQNFLWPHFTQSAILFGSIKGHICTPTSAFPCKNCSHGYTCTICTPSALLFCLIKGRICISPSAFVITTLVHHHQHFL